jgi:hypothetical protein
MAGERKTPRLEDMEGDYEVLEDFPVSGPGQPPEPAILVPTGNPGEYDIANSPLGARFIRISEAFPGTDDLSVVQGDC